MSLFTLIKITRTRHLLGKKQVAPGTPGSVKVKEESANWYAYRRDGSKQIKVKLFTDKAASVSKLAKMNTALERGQAEMTDPRKEHLKRGAAEHLDEFLPVMRAKGKSEKDKDRKEAVLRAFAGTLKSARTRRVPASRATQTHRTSPLEPTKLHISLASITTTGPTFWGPDRGRAGCPLGTRC
ncbi:hypothetical protein J8F10_03795 [Gemmata sp. G18]|uniref:Arm DNA-binding domain-containing protein n=1 Tax=Gemmata palustris TaxID=2822762 RepID=A0ABS5BL49_9BACT|nr:hypothetical protein [Gemmata palustris]MBP3954413.1 hypothetical protein [Gemmata palustris]